MRIQRMLLKWFLLETSTINVVAVIVWTGYVLFKGENLEVFEPWPWVFIGMHGYALTVALGRIESSSFAFLYSRGYTRDILWIHKITTTVFSVLVALLPVVIFILLPVRCLIQDKIFRNPYYPILSSYDQEALWAWLIGYVVAFPVYFYAWIRRAQPTTHKNSGDWLCAAFLMAAFMSFNLVSYRSLMWMRIVVTAGMLISGIMLCSGWKLHRNVEVTR